MRIVKPNPKNIPDGLRTMIIDRYKQTVTEAWASLVSKYLFKQLFHPDTTISLETIEETNKYISKYLLLTQGKEWRNEADLLIYFDNVGYRVSNLTGNTIPYEFQVKEVNN